MSDQILDKIEELRAEIEKLSAYGVKSHYVEGDWRYSCPKSKVGCWKNKDDEDCNCGADEINAEVATIKAGLDAKVDELISVVMQTPI
jgi:hypothetical protein